MASSIYREIILEHYRRPHNYGKIVNPTKKSSLANPSCGDEICLEIVVSRGKILEAKFTGKGCAISLASASLLTDYIKGKSLGRLAKIGEKLVPKLLGAEISPSRMKCALLPIEALKKIMADFKC